jgi:hypothetical protein
MNAMVGRLGSIEIVKSAGAVGTALAPISGALNGLLDLFMKVGGWYRPLGFSDSAGQFSDDVNEFVGKLANINIDAAQLATIKSLGESLTPAVSSFRGLLDIFKSLNMDYKRLNIPTLENALDDMRQWVEAVAHATSWGDWGTNMGLSFIQGITNAIANSADRQELERQLGMLANELPQGAGGGNGAPATASSQQNVVINITGNNFVVRNDEDVQAIAQAIVDQALAAMGMRSVQMANQVVPQW